MLRLHSIRREYGGERTAMLKTSLEEFKAPWDVRPENLLKIFESSPVLKKKKKETEPVRERENGACYY